jgi:negative regulator of sigma-B (phosphoserine phosphatase)
MTLVHEHSSLALEPLLEQCERRLRGTRGAVASLAKLDCKRSLLDHLGLGDITTQIVRRDGTHRMTGQRGFVGSNQPQLGKRRLESVPLGSGDILLAYTDGLKSRIDISREAALLREHPIVIADFILRHFQRQDDDALVLVLR